MSLRLVPPMSPDHGHDQLDPIEPIGSAANFELHNKLKEACSNLAVTRADLDKYNNGVNSPEFSKFYWGGYGCEAWLLTRQYERDSMLVIVTIAAFDAFFRFEEADIAPELYINNQAYNPNALDYLATLANQSIDATNKELGLNVDFLNDEDMASFEQALTEVEQAINIATGQTTNLN